MDILTSSVTLDLSGVPTYTLTMVRELERRGHRVTVYCPGGGWLVDQMRCVSGLDGLEPPDVILAQHNICAVSLRERFLETPLVFSSHGVTPEVDQPPSFEAGWYTAINEDVRENMINKGVPPEKITIVRNFVDVERFRPEGPLNEKLSRVLYVSNFKKWRTYAVVVKTCSRLGLELKTCGSPYGRCRQIERDINRADLIISVGRGVLEAMACGRPVISFDQMRGDGYLTPEGYYESRTRNFTGARCRHSFDVTGLAAQLERYDPAHGAVNRELILEHHDHKRGVDQILDVMGKLL